MRHSSGPTEKNLVLIGGGHAHVTVIKHFAERPIPGVKLTVISRDLLAPYSGMLPGYIAGHYSLSQCHIDLAPLVRYANGHFIHAEVVGLDTEQKHIHCRDGASIHYDIVSINIGSSPDLSDSGNDDTGVIPVKPISGFVDHWRRLQARVLQSEGRLNIATVGAGAGGVELTLAIQHRLQRELQQHNKNDLQLRFHIFDSHGEVLVSHNRKVRRQFERILKQRQIALHLNRRIVSADRGQLITAAGEQFAMDEVLWVTRASAQRWLRNTGLVLTPDGFISVEPTLRSVSHADVFAVGDIAHVVAHPRPKAGVFAVRQGAPLARNLYRAFNNKPLQPFRPQSEFLSLISTGDKQAVASRAQWMFKGKLMWHWKDWIDRRFMAKFNQLPEAGT